MSSPHLATSTEITNLGSAISASFRYALGSVRRWIVPALVLSVLQVALLIGGQSFAVDLGAGPFSGLLSSVLLSLVTSLGIFLFGVWFTGMTLDRGAASKISLVRRAVAYFFSALLSVIALFLLSGVAFASLGACSVLTLGSLAGGTSITDCFESGVLIFFLLLLPVIYIAIRLSQISVAAVARGRILDSFTHSWALTRKRFWKVLGWTIVFAIINLILSWLLTIPTGIVVGLLLGLLGAGGEEAYFALLVGSTAISSAVVSMLILPFSLSLSVTLYEQLEKDVATR